jgi:pimeloyl-ACP methyl ester carboxylesterase
MTKRIRSRSLVVTPAVKNWVSGVFSRLFFAAVLLLGAGRLSAAQLDVLDIPGVTLRDNPLGDPPARHLAVYKPDEVKDDAPLPLVIYLPGWGGSSEDAIAAGRTAWFGTVVDQLAGTTPVRIAVVDGRSRYGGSQFLNSTATGRYADYVADEILAALTARYASPKTGLTPILAGHSSGAYGALLLTINRHEKFPAVVALSPDSDFATTHKPIVEDAGVRAVTRAELDAAMAPPQNAHLPANELAGLVMGLSANYTPIAGQPGHFEWLYDEKGQWRPEVWQRWLDQDPFVIVRGHADAFAPTQRIFLNGAEHDEWGANIGARKIYEILKSRPAPVTFYESPGLHGDNLPDRLARGLTWVFGKGQ